MVLDFHLSASPYFSVDGSDCPPEMHRRRKRLHSAVGSDTAVGSTALAGIKTLSVVEVAEFGLHSVHRFPG